MVQVTPYELSTPVYYAPAPAPHFHPHAHSFTQVYSTAYPQPAVYSSIQPQVSKSPEINKALPPTLATPFATAMVPALDPAMAPTMPHALPHELPPPVPPALTPAFLPPPPWLILFLTLCLELHLNKLPLRRKKAPKTHEETKKSFVRSYIRKEFEMVEKTTKIPNFKHLYATSATAYID